MKGCTLAEPQNAERTKHSVKGGTRVGPQSATENYSFVKGSTEVGPQNAAKNAIIQEAIRRRDERLLWKSDSGELV